MWPLSHNFHSLSFHKTFYPLTLWRHIRTALKDIVLFLKVSGTMMHKVKCTDCTTLKKCNIIHQTGLKVKKWFSNKTSELSLQTSKIYLKILKSPLNIKNYQGTSIRSSNYEFHSICWRQKQNFLEHMSNHIFFPL